MSVGSSRAADWPVIRVVVNRESRERLLPMVAALSIVLTVLHVIFVIAGFGRTSGGSDFNFTYGAARALVGGQDPYREFLGCCNGAEDVIHGYIYPPLLALALSPLARLPLATASAAWLGVMSACMLATVVVTQRLVGDSLTRSAQWLLLAASLLFLPLQLNLQALQLGPLLALCLAIAAYGFVRPTDRAYAGAALGLGGVIRLSPALPTVLFVRRPRDLLGAPLLVAVATAGGLLALMLFITPTTTEYVTRVLPKLGRGSAYFENLSPAGVAMRAEVLFSGAEGGWLPRLVEVGALCLVGVTWVRARKADGERARAVAFAAMLAVIPMVSPLTWNHHLLTELLVFALLAPSLARDGKLLVLAVSAYLLLDGVGQAGLALAVYTLQVSGRAAAWVILGGNVSVVIGMALLWLACIRALSPGGAQGRPSP